jgi:hypothetical protein
MSRFNNTFQFQLDINIKNNHFFIYSLQFTIFARGISENPLNAFWKSGPNPWKFNSEYSYLFLINKTRL